MSTLDHILTFPSEAAAHAALSQIAVKTHERLPPTPISNGTGWHQGCVIPRTTLVAVPATYDGDGNQLTAAVHVPGHHMAIALVERCPELEALPNCRIVLDREASAGGLPVAVYTAPDINPNWRMMHVSPIFGDYQFGVAP